MARHTQRAKEMDRRNTGVVEVPELRFCAPTLNRTGLRQCIKRFRISVLDLAREVLVGSLSEIRIRNFVRKSISPPYPKKTHTYMGISDLFQ